MSPDGSTFLFRSAPRGIDRNRLRLFQDTLTTLLTSGRAFTCLLTSDAELRRLNNTFLGHDYATDVLSFPALEGEESLGDLAISATRAKAQAAEFGHAIEAEIEILMLHGALICSVTIMRPTRAPCAAWNPAGAKSLASPPV